MNTNDRALSTSYFRRFFVPVVLTMLVFAAIYVVIATPPNTPMPWQTYDTVFGGAEAVVGMLGGAVRRAATGRRLK